MYTCKNAVQSSSHDENEILENSLKLGPYFKQSCLIMPLKFLEQKLIQKRFWFIV